MPETDAVAQRLARGAEQRRTVPLEAHADLVVDGRPDPVGVLREQDEARLQRLVPIRHARMQVSPFTFYRGGAAIMAGDLARGPTTDLRAQLCGDAHLSNFGVFMAPDRRLLFDLNDFDETSPGPFEWDLKRLAASVTIASRHNGHSDKQARSATRAAVRGYRDMIQVAITRSPLDLHYARIEIDRFLDDDDEPLHKRSRKAIAKATRKDSMRALVKLTEMVDGQRRIVDRPPLIEGLRGRLRDDQLDELRTLFFRYVESLPPHRAAVLERYRVLDVALKVVGVGSVGTRCLIVLLESDQGAPLFLQFKEAVDSVLERHAGPSGWEHAGERVVRGQRAMQAAGDVLLGWASYDEQGGRTVDFYFRQLWDGKGSAEVDQMGPKRLKRYAEVCGRTLALGHARTGDGVAIAGYLGTDRTIDDAIAVFSERYADLDEADHRAHGEAIAAGRVPSQVIDA